VHLHRNVAECTNLQRTPLGMQKGRDGGRVGLEEPEHALFRYSAGRAYVETAARIEKQSAHFDKRLEALRADLIKWAFLFWMPTALAVLGLYFR